MSISGVSLCFRHVSALFVSVSSVTLCFRHIFVFFVSVSGVTLCFRHVFVFFVPVSGVTLCLRHVFVFFVPVSGVSLCFRHVFVLFVSVSCRRAANIRNIYDGSTFRVMWPSYLFSFSKLWMVLLIFSLCLVRFRSLARLILSICICLSATLLTDGL